MTKSYRDQLIDKELTRVASQGYPCCIEAQRTDCYAVCLQHRADALRRAQSYWLINPRSRQNYQKHRKFV